MFILVFFVQLFGVVVGTSKTAFVGHVIGAKYLEISVETTVPLILLPCFSVSRSLLASDKQAKLPHRARGALKSCGSAGLASC